MTIAEDIKVLEEALEAGPDVCALYTHWRDSNKWRENEAYLKATSPDRIKRLIESHAKAVELIQTSLHLAIRPDTELAEKLHGFLRDCGHE